MAMGGPMLPKLRTSFGGGGGGGGAGALSSWADRCAAGGSSRRKRVVLGLAALAVVLLYVLSTAPSRLSSSRGGGGGGGDARGRGGVSASSSSSASSPSWVPRVIGAAAGGGSGFDVLASLQQRLAYGSAGPSGILGGTNASGGLSAQAAAAADEAVAAAEQAVADAQRDAARAPAAVSGRVQKTGMLAPAAWLAAHADERVDSFLSWRVNRTRAERALRRRIGYDPDGSAAAAAAAGAEDGEDGGDPAAAAAAAAAAGGRGDADALDDDPLTCESADHPPLPYPGCHVFVNHQYRYVYIRSPKAASTSVVDVLGECGNAATAGHNASSCMALHWYWNQTELEPARLSAMWRDYFVFGFARNPWRRAFSLFKYLHSSGCQSDASLKDPGCRVTWPDFCADPWTAAESLHDRRCAARTRSYLYFHMADQTRCMLAADGGWAVDFIGRVESVNEDWLEVVKELNQRRLPGVPELVAGELEQKNTRASHVSDPYGAPDARHCFGAVSRWYACDVERLGFTGQALAARRAAKEAARAGTAAAAAAAATADADEEQPQPQQRRQARAARRR